MKIYKQNETDKLAEILKKDGVICVPTDTVFGVCARINSIKAHDRLVKVKKRPEEKIFPIMCADEEQIENIAIVDERTKIIIHNFMPGPITLILNKKPYMPDYINNGGSTIAVRMATSKALKDLIKKTESPIFMSSANLSGKTACTSLDEIEKSGLVLDGIMEGTVKFGKASTIVDCTKKEIKILRLGPITIEQINEKLRV